MKGYLGREENRVPVTVGGLRGAVAPTMPLVTEVITACRRAGDFDGAREAYAFAVEHFGGECVRGNAYVQSTMRRVPGWTGESTSVASSEQRRESELGMMAAVQCGWVLLQRAAVVNYVVGAVSTYRGIGAVG